jgi:hypothetical protein
VSLVIPHGTSWGATAPPGVSWASQSTSEQHDPRRQRLIEVYSGHGNSEEYRAWASSTPDGECPEATPDYLPICRQAGKLVADRCLAEGEEPVLCDERAATARSNAVAAGRNAVLTLPGTPVSDWGDAEQCSDCFLPAFAYRPGKSAQAALALRSPGSPAMRFGLMASSDNHSARPGTGYKQVRRIGMTDERAIASPRLAALAAGLAPQPSSVSKSVLPEQTGVGIANSERQAGFWSTGGLVAVHAGGRDREAIWSALERREVYGTSGPRILLWFDLLNPATGTALPMGSEAEIEVAPRFSVRGVGSAEPMPGCPDTSVSALGAAEIERLCLGECFHPSDERRSLDRIEVVRIRPGDPGQEALASRIEDPWRVLDCPADGRGCEVEFDGEVAAPSEGEVLYYVRAIEAATPTIHGDGRRCQAAEDDCLGPAAHRAWSSPIFLRRPAESQTSTAPARPRPRASPKHAPGSRGSAGRSSPASRPRRVSRKARPTASG